MTDSPWGHIQYREPIAPGISWVSTAGHGGLCLSAQFAQQHLTQAAQHRAILQDGCYWYEEDCLYAIPAYEMPEIWPALFSNSSLSPEERRRDLLRIIGHYHADYLVERGIQSDPATPSTPVALHDFVIAHCRGQQYDSCINSPCPYSSTNGCSHPLHPRRQP